MNSKYEFVPGDTITIAPGRTVKRIRALVAIAAMGVLPGDTGGYIESETNLNAQVSGNAWIYGNAQVYGDAQVSGDARVYGNARVFGDAQVSGDARVYGNARVFGDAQVSGNAWIYGNAQVYGDAQVSGDARVYGNARVSKTPICVSGLTWHVTISDTHMAIGCQCHALTDWAGFSDAQISAMDGRNALRFWRQHKAYLLSLRTEEEITP